MRWLLPVSLVLAGLAFVPPAAADPGTDFFEKRIRPVFVEHCSKCHSTVAGKQKGGLNLDSRAGVLKGGDSGPALVPGKPDESLLVKAVRYADEGLRMPPKGKLPDAVVADLEKWVAMGAPDPRGTTPPAAAMKALDLAEGRKFWAFQSPRQHPVPAVKDAAWPRSDIDRFLLARLEAQGTKPAGDTDKATLLRRVAFDLIGLPPTPEQLDAFLADQSPEAFARVVDGLLASPHFGERWGRHWLDVARYAESSGGGRSLLFKDAWRYRDYVIDAFNRDKPFDRFVVEQVAGDLLPFATPQDRHDQLVATAFLVLGPTNYERQDKDVLEMDVIDEQLDTLGRAFLGMTIGCARCHDHKFDPIPTRDYYALAGIFKSTQVMIHDNVSRWVEMPLPMSPQEQAAVKAHDAAVAAVQTKLKQARGGKGAVASGAVAPTALPGIVLDDTQAKRVGPWKHSTYSGTFVGSGYLYDERGMKGDKTLTFVPDFPEDGRYEVRLAYVPHSNRANKVPVTILHLDGETAVHVNQREAPPLDGRFVSLGTYRFDKNGPWFVLVSNDGTNGHISVDAVQFLPEAMVKEERRPAKPGKPGNAKRLEDELKRLQAKGPERPVAMAVKEAKVEDCHVCIRGVTHNRGEEVPRGFLQVMMRDPMPTLPGKESGRRELAAWLVSPDNPLTARVMVNRVWHYLFGTGLVRTVDNFGTTGELPSHPELLDYLALQLVREGWSVKALVRSIVLSRAYQMRCDGPLADPENRLLARMNRHRLDAEAIRDAILAVSGRLDRTLGGPTMRKGTASEYGYQFDDVRRSVYTPVFRNRLLELFEAFDFADPNLVGGRRNVSTVATQALFLMNSPFVLEEARHAAKAALASPGPDEARVERAYRAALGRLPTARERELALACVGGASEEERVTAWERFYQALFACLDFRYVN
jgi:hypothetical protein